MCRLHVNDAQMLRKLSEIFGMLPVLTSLLCYDRFSVPATILSGFAEKCLCMTCKYQ